jgi:hypothetical protein
MENRTAVFASQPQSVEVYQAGAWWAGELLGWRHDDGGSCQVWVRVVLGGVEETAWTDLAALRLPERHLSVAPEPGAVADAATTQTLPRASSRREGSALTEAGETASMPMLRDLAVISGGAPRPGGRRRAPEGPETVAAPVPSSPRSGGRRRAPESALETATADAVAAGSVAVPVGRHRASTPADAGRHRAADTGLLPAVTEVASALSGAVPVPPARSARIEDTFGGRTRGAWIAAGEAEPELLTRPMRLSDRIPHARRPRLDGSLTGV